MTSRGAGPALSRKNYRLSTEPEKSKVTGTGWTRLYIVSPEGTTVQPPVCIGELLKLEGAPCCGDVLHSAGV
uniref:Uncharacterized protein n=1 Tax=Cairina moschata TaxID=8855 RepID=A0A8C3BB01_CAIMO